MPLADPHDRRESDVPVGDTARILAIIYILGYLIMVGMLLFVELPASNKDIVNSLVSIMSAVQLAIIGYFYGGSKSAEVSQKAGVAGRAQADAALQEIAKAVPAVLPVVVKPEVKGDLNVSTDPKP